jgi:hypothetical protein
MTSLITTVAQAMQTVLTEKADKAAVQSQFVRRKGAPLGGAVFVQSTVFTCLANPLPTLDHFAQKAAALGVVVTPEAFAQRFTESAATCLRLTLADAVARVISSQPPLIPLLQRFSTVDIQDSTTVALPDCLQNIWKGTGGSTEEGTASAVKLQVRLDLCSGRMTGPFPEHGKASDQRSALQDADEAPRGSLRIADLGYFDLETFARLGQRDAFWLSRLLFGTVVFDESGQRLDLLGWLKEQTAEVTDVPVQLGVEQRLAARLVALRVPEAVARVRRARLLKKARKKGKKPSARQLALCHWTVLVTNLPVALVGATEMVVLARCRWQIELLFKVWKSDGGLDKSRSQKPWRVLCEVYAKLIGLVVQHWVCVAGCWQVPAKSLRKAAQPVREMALALAGALKDLRLLEWVLSVAVAAMQAGTSSHRSKADPRTYQLLEDPQCHTFSCY